MCVVSFSGGLFLGVVGSGVGVVVVLVLCWPGAGWGLLVSLFVFCVVGEVCCGVY